ncbi:hypothetical protein J6590_028728 [Homalodisca vitripennis]|nr:hypothetical protein J6590_028728 [Homalodisca vitripennis]
MLTGVAEAVWEIYDTGRTEGHCIQIDGRNPDLSLGRNRKTARSPNKTIALLPEGQDILDG